MFSDGAAGRGFGNYKDWVNLCLLCPLSCINKYRLENFFCNLLSNVDFQITVITLINFREAFFEKVKFLRSIHTKKFKGKYFNKFFYFSKLASSSSLPSKGPIAASRKFFATKISCARF